MTATTSGSYTLSLHDALPISTYTGGSGSNSLIFSYTVAAGQNTSDLAIADVSTNVASGRHAAGNAGNNAGAVTNPSGILTIDTVAPGVPLILQLAAEVRHATG